MVDWNPQSFADNVGGFFSDPLSATRSFGGGVSNAFQSSENFGGLGQKLTPTNNFVPNMPINNFQAQAPNFPTVDFTTAIRGALNNGGPTMIPATQGGLDQNAFAQALMGRGNTAYGQEQNLIGQLQQEAAGNGPGAQLAQQQLKQATENNIKQSSGMLASQKGINPALAARLIGQNAAATNQQAVGQGMNLGLQQQLAARQQLGGMLGNDLGLNTSGAANLLGTATGQSIQQELGTGALDLQKLGLLISGGQGQNNLGVNAGLSTNAVNAGVAAGNQNAGNIGQQIQGGVASQNTGIKGQLEGGLINAAGSAGAAALGASGGAKIPGKAKYDGDDPRNDVVNAKLSPGEVVIPRSAANDPEKAAEFVRALKGGDKPKSQAKGYGKILEKHRELQKKMAELEALIGRHAA